MSQTKTKLKPYKETLDNVLYSKDYETTSSNGSVFPTNRIKVEVVSYSGEVQVKGEVREYTGQKVVITNSKLQLQDGQNVIKQKSVKTAYGDNIVNDETKVKLTPDEFTELLKNFSKKTETA